MYLSTVTLACKST